MTSNKSVTIRKLDHEARQIKPIKELGAISSKSFYIGPLFVLVLPREGQPYTIGDYLRIL